MESKQCTKCNQIKDIISFRERNIKNKLTIVSYCRQCERDERMIYYWNKEKIVKNIPDREYPKQVLIEGILHFDCAGCKEIKPDIAFGKSKKNSHGFSRYCKFCKKLKDKIGHIKFHKDRAIKAKIYREKNKDIIRIKTREKNKRERSTIHGKLKHSLSNRLRHALKNGGIIKDVKTLEILGCTISDFKIYIEKQFELGMSWENYGINTWHIDHKIPCASFDLSDPGQQRKCFHYSNMRPLWAFENLSKSDNEKAIYTYNFSEACMI